MLNGVIKRDNWPPILAAGLFLYVVIGAFMRPEPAVKPAAAPIAVTQDNQATPDFTQMSAWHLFGQPDAQAAGVAAAAEIAPETPLDLKLQGVFYLGSDKNQAYAIITTTADQIQKTYQINEQLPNGSILQTIAHDHVTLLANNVSQSLPLSRHEASEAGEVPAEAPPAE
jgi:hypothetical protein